MVSGKGATLSIHRNVWSSGSDIAVSAKGGTFPITAPDATLQKKRVPLITIQQSAWRTVRVCHRNP